MKVWLGAAAALSGAGTLAYLLVRSSQRGRGNGTPSKTSESHSTKGSEDSHDASIRKDDSCERLNGHLPTEGQADSVSEMPSAAECHKEAKQQNLSERSLTSGEMCDVNAGVERLSSNLDENLSELVSAIQDKIVKSDSLSNTSTCEEVNIRAQTDDKEISQPTTVEGIVADLAHTHDKPQQDARPGPEKDRETRECISICAIEEKVVASSEKEIPINASNQETVSSDTDSSSLEGTACVSNPIETSLSVPEPVVEELSQCRILKPQCDPCCCEDHSETCLHTPASVSTEFTEFSDENNATLNAQKATQESTQNENPGIPPERHYTLTLKSNEENFCISGKHIHDPSPTEAPFAEGQEGGAELNKDEPGTCIVTIEQREKVDEKQVPPSPLSSSQEECPLRNESVYYECNAAAGKDYCGESEAKERTTSANTKAEVLETDDEMMQPIGNTALETPTPVQEQGSIEEDATQDQGQSDIKQEVPQEQKRIATEQENTEEQQHSDNMDSAPEKETHSSSNEKVVVPLEQKMNASEAEENNKRQEHSTSEQVAPKEEEQSSCSEQDMPQEQKQDHDEEERRAEKQKQSEGKQSSIVQEETLKQEQKDNKQKTTPKQKPSKGKQETRLSGKKQLEVTQKQEKESSNKQHKAQVEQEQTNSNKQVAATTQEQVEKEGTQNQKEGNKKQKLAKREEQPHPREEKKEGVKEQKLTKEEEQASPGEGTKEDNEKQKLTKEEEQASPGEGTKEDNEKQKLTKEEEQASPREETKKDDEKQKLTKEEEQASPREETKKDDEKQKLTKEEEQASPREETKEGDKKQKLTMEEEQASLREETQDQKEGNKKQKVTKKEEQPSQREGTQKQKESNKEQKITQKEEKSNHTQDTGMEKKEESNNKQQVTQTGEQMNHEKEITSPEQSAKVQVKGDQMALSPSKRNNNNSGGKKGSVRSRGDSASADLDCDVGSEHDNINCDSSSLKSTDSGQGSSEIEPETLFAPSNFPVTNREQYIFYDFEIPQMLVGRLIGRKGAFINKIKAATEATVIVHPHKNRKLKLCSVEGTKQQVNAALELIREHFPESQYPDITLQQVSTQHQIPPAMQPTLNAPSMQIELTAGVVVEVRVSTVVSGGELWVQQPLHPSYSALHRLHTCMNLNYGDGSNTPPLPNPISDGTVCVAHIKDHWMRCQVLSSLNGVSLVLPLDVGGTISLPSSSLRQIRYDYMTLPFQATQCFLYGLQPIEGDTWSDTATSVMEELVRGTILSAVVVSYTEDCVPLVNLYRRDQNHFVLLNEKLVELDHAQWISPQPCS
ncbi:neurofilament heavy polypeptide-like [Eriocheir sinensis]|uniref:neurofilament heavy polypeptide-like n=1 Tax=Eriocheir sinensis TaxID=95602 RepID=UPI0021C733F6|nr:neurofilament heavy polypeptide-like [Eriocheir sinensis]XP_050736737.1 neurofilament heavy polypeptide-like [Eriocheir sinensis]XP_050736738.1 neurofilament heavy polypeptide-like [Eriocheir sinensis]